MRVTVIIIHILCITVDGVGGSVPSNAVPSTYNILYGISVTL